MPQDPKHSIVITTRNEGERLRRTVDDVLQHGVGESLEILVIDDASEDASTDFLKTSEYADKPIRCERNVERRGLIWSRGLGARLARGDYLSILDAHCSTSPGWLAGLATHLERIDGRGLVVPLVHYLDEESWHVNHDEVPASACSLVNPFFDFGWVEPTIIDGKVCTCTIGGMAWMCRRDWYEHLGGLDVEMVAWGGENIDLPLRTWIAGGWCLIAPDVRLGHLFQEGKVHSVSSRELAVNKIRAAHTAFSRTSFQRILGNLLFLDDFRAAVEHMHAAPGSLARIKERVETTRSRSDRWLIDTFRLPIFEALFFYLGKATIKPPTVVRGMSRPQRVERPTVQVVLSLNDPSLLESRLETLLEGSSYTNFDVAVSLRDGTREPDQRRSFAERPRVQLVRWSPGNSHSFPESLGAALGNAEYLALLDDRTQVRSEDWIEQLLLLFDAHPKLVLACPETRRVGADGSDAGRHYETTWDWGAPAFRRTREGAPLSQSPYQVFSCPETLLFLRRQMFLELGGFDASLRGLEERLLEFSIRAWLSGYEVYCHPGVVVAREEVDGEVSPDGAFYPPADCWRDYAQVLPAVKCFTNQKRVRSCMEHSPRSSSILNWQADRIERQRKRLIEGARFDDDWLFYKFGIPDYPE